MESGFTNTGFIQLDFIEEGRKNIFEWREKRRCNQSGLRGRINEITKLFINRSILRSFISNLSIVVGFQMLLAALCTYACVKLNLEFDVQMSLFVSPIIFPLAFSINANYQRRETVLEDLAMFKAASLILFFCHRDWITSIGLPVDLLKTLSNKLKFLVINIREYLLTDESQKRQFILQAVYEDFSDVSQLNDKLRTSELKSNSSLIARIIHCHNLMCWSFEKLRVIREYKSPRSLHSFTKVFIFLMPLLLSPYYVHRGQQTKSYWAPYYISVLVSFLFGSLQAVQDKLDDPFDGIGEDDVNLSQLDDWTLQSLLTNRTVTVGRFTVTTTTGAQEDKSNNKSPLKTCFSQQEEIIHLNKIPSPKKRRRSSARKRDSIAEKFLDDEQFTNELESRCHGIASKLEGLSGSTTILPGNRIAYFVEKQKSPPPGVSSGRETENINLVRKKQEKPRSVLPQRDGLEVVRESEEYGDESTDTSPVPERSTVMTLFGNDTDTVTSDDSATGETIKNGGFPKSERTKYEGPTVYLRTRDIAEESTTDEWEPLNNRVPGTECEKRPTVMELFGLAKNSESNSAKGEQKKSEKPEQLSLLSNKGNTSGSPTEVGVPLHSPHTSCEEEFSEDNCDAARRHSTHETGEKSLPKLKFSLGRRKRQQWSMPNSLSKWRKKRPKKKPPSQGKTEEKGSKTEVNITTSTSLLLCDEAGSECRYNEVSPDKSRTSHSTEESTPDYKQPHSKDIEDSSLIPVELRTSDSQPIDSGQYHESSSDKPKSRFAVSKS